MKLKLSIIVTLFCCFYNYTFAQEKSFWPDSILTFQLQTKDTLNRRPLSREDFTYSNDNKLIQKKTFRWDEESKTWIKLNSYKISHFPTEILIEKYNIENQKQEIFAGRSIISYDTSTNLIREVKKYSKDRYSPDYILREKYEFEYKNGNLIHSSHFLKGSTFFKENEVSLIYSKNKVAFNKTYFIETKVNPIRCTKTLYTLLKDSIQTILTTDSSHYFSKTLDSIAYFDSNRIKKFHFIIKKTSDKAIQFKDKNTITTYLSSKSEKTYLLKKITQCEGQRPCQEDEMVIYYFNNKREKRKENIGLYSLFDFLSE